MKKIDPKQTATMLVTAALGLCAANSASAYELHPFGTNSPAVDFHGFASQGFLYSSKYNYLADNTTDGSFKFSEAGLNASMNPFPRTRITAQAFTFNVGDVGQYDVVLDYCLAEYTFSDKFGVRAGRIRRPAGIYNSIQDIDLARTSVLLPQGVYDARWRDFSSTIDGGEFFGSFSLGKGGSLAYEVYAGVINMADNGGVARNLQDGLPPAPIGSYDSINQCQIYGSQLWWNTPVNGLRFGVSGGLIPDFGYKFAVTPPFGPGPIHTEYEIPFGQASAEYLWKAWTFQAEYYTYNVSGNQFITGNIPITSSDTRTEAWYASAAYRVNKWLEVGTYYTESYANTKKSTDFTQYQKDAALSLRFDLRDWWIFKVEGHYIHGTGLLQDSQHNPSQNDKGWFMLAVKTTVSF